MIVWTVRTAGLLLLLLAVALPILGISRQRRAVRASLPRQEGELRPAMVRLPQGVALGRQRLRPAAQSLAEVSELVEQVSQREGRRYRLPTEQELQEARRIAAQPPVLLDAEEPEWTKETSRPGRGFRLAEDR